MNDVLSQSQAMCREATRVEATTHCDVLIKHLDSKWKDVTSKIDELLDLPAEKRIRKGLLGKVLTAVFGANEEVYNDIKDLRKGNSAEVSNQRTTSL